jgi:hypothetical protein
MEEIMKMLDRLFGRGKDYPPLPQDSQATARLDEIHEELESLTHKVRDRLEIVPADHAAFIFLGKPPKRFGIAWIHDGKVSSLKELVDEHHLTPAGVDQLLNELGEAYTHATDAPRYCSHVGNKDVVVIPSKDLENEVQEILQHTIH